MNRLAQSISPYLLQHADNPVDWFPWGDEALETARVQQRPIFLSIGYSTCHWCHVMARESFENEQVASLLNKEYICIKVDREERPDLDELYMEAVLMLSGSGGWPMSVFLTPDLKPFFGGTYFPPENRHGRTGFTSILTQIADAWKNRRGEVVSSAEGITERVVRVRKYESGSSWNEAIVASVKDLLADFDSKYGGFGGAPKFPQSLPLAFLMRQYRNTGDEKIKNAVTFTLDSMARGGLFDHVGGGFYRYSTDEKWVLPHFEKMLCDNAQLASLYLDSFLMGGNRDHLRIAESVLAYVSEQLTSPEGLFYSAEDADSEGEEGKFYLWKLSEIDQILGDQADAFISFFGIRKTGNFASHEPYHRGLNTLVDESIRYPEGIVESLAKLKVARAKRIRPSRDEKAIASWNGLMIGAFADAYRVTGREKYRTQAETAAEFILSAMIVEGKLMRIYREGVVQQAGFLEDYAFFANGLLKLYEATLDVKWIFEAQKCAEIIRVDFLSKDEGRLFTTAEYHTDLIVRKESQFDGVIPSGTSATAELMYRLSVYLKNDSYSELARNLVEQNVGLMERASQSMCGLMNVAQNLISSPAELTIAVENQTEQGALVRRINDCWIPDRFLMIADQLPGSEGKALVDNKSTLWRCENNACFPPENDLEKAIVKLSRCTINS